MKASQALDTGSIPVTRSTSLSAPERLRGAGKRGIIKSSFVALIVFLVFFDMGCAAGVSVQKTPTQASFRDNPRFIWPLAGIVQARFGQRVSGIRSKGLRIAPSAYPGTVQAVSEGRIGWVHRDAGVYGSTIALIHPDGYVSVYSGCLAVCVTTGMRVGQGQKIAVLEQSDGRYQGLYFELRRSAIPVDPEQYLSAPNTKV